MGRVIQQVTAVPFRPPCRNAQEAHHLRQVLEERNRTPSCPCYFPQRQILFLPLGGEVGILIPINHKIPYVSDYGNMDSFSFVMKRTDGKAHPHLISVPEEIVEDPRGPQSLGLPARG